eukprot:TRINITY_DN3493_c0_g1_i1.p1 TRINITY_DN3493_c0_g1~~TRINITY_DN3493_c0_g1_i1.p1  ORF type:complete len:795 (+),score=120.02 TRINITY_DN3493_c0_g1_i1:3-2387(+)
MDSYRWLYIIALRHQQDTPDRIGRLGRPIPPPTPVHMTTPPPTVLNRGKALGTSSKPAIRVHVTDNNKSKKSEKAPPQSVKTLAEQFARDNSVDPSCYDWQKVQPSSRWDFVRVTKHARGPTKEDDIRERRKNTVYAGLIVISVAIMVIALLLGFDLGSGVYVESPAANGLKVVGSVLTLVLIILAVDHRVYSIKVILMDLDVSPTITSLGSSLMIKPYMQMVFEILLLMGHPIPFVTSTWANDIGLLAFLRLIFLLRPVRDRMPVYRKRRLIRKEPRLLMYAHEGSFTLLTVTRDLFTRHTGWCIAVILLLTSTVFPFSILVAERDTQPSVSYGTWIYYCYITMSTVGYGDYSPKTTLGKVLACFIALSGLLITALSVSAVGKWLTPTKQELEVSNWIRERKTEKQWRVIAASYIQLNWRYFRYVRQKHGQNSRRDRIMQEVYEVRAAVYVKHLRRYRRERNWSVLHATSPLQMDVDTLLGYTHDVNYNVANMCHELGVEPSTASLPLTGHENDNKHTIPSGGHKTRRKTTKASRREHRQRPLRNKVHADHSRESSPGPSSNQPTREQEQEQHQQDDHYDTKSPGPLGSETPSRSRSPSPDLASSSSSVETPVLRAGHYAYVAPETEAQRRKSMQQLLIRPRKSVSFVHAKHSLLGRSHRSLHHRHQPATEEATTSQRSDSPSEHTRHHIFHSGHSHSKSINTDHKEHSPTPMTSSLPLKQSVHFAPSYYTFAPKSGSPVVSAASLRSPSSSRRDDEEEGEGEVYNTHTLDGDHSDTDSDDYDHNGNETNKSD